MTSSLPSQPQTILIVEDDPSLLELCNRFLTSAEFNVLTSDDGYQALKMCKEHRGRIHLELIDLMLPPKGMRLKADDGQTLVQGLELAEKLRALRPLSRVLVMSAYNREELATYGIDTKGWPFLQKPFSREGLLEAVGQALTQRP